MGSADSIATVRESSPAAVTATRLADAATASSIQGIKDESAMETHLSIRALQRGLPHGKLRCRSQTTSG
jgi:hypothetical protein